MYKFEGPQEYTHPDQLIRPAGKTERYSNTGNTYLHQKMHSFPWQNCMGVHNIQILQ